jgi:hypothetical protein
MIGQGSEDERRRGDDGGPVAPARVGDLLDRPWALQVAGSRLGHGFHAVDAPSEQSGANQHDAQAGERLLR